METDPTEVPGLGANVDVFHHVKDLSDEQRRSLEHQNSRLVPTLKAAKLEREAQRHWDLFYKRNETKFFRDRHWTTREFHELLSGASAQEGEKRRGVLLELGCGVGNLVYPLLEEGSCNFYFYACDFSPRAVEFVKSNRLYDESKIKAFQSDITKSELFDHIEEGSVDIVTLIFVLSAIHPDKWHESIRMATRALRPGGLVLLRDYGRHDMAQLRFKPGHKIADNFYMRQDGTRSYYFTVEELLEVSMAEGLEVLSCEYVQRRTLNVKENLDVPRIFVQGKFRKPLPDL